MTMADHFKTAAKLEEIRNTVKALAGDEWSEKSKPFRELLEQGMKEAGITNPLPVMLP